MSGRFSVLGVAVSAMSREAVAGRLIDAARDGTGLGISALAVHGVMLAVRRADLRTRLNRLDIVAPDGQPVRWALNMIHGVGLRERVYGPDLMLDVCERARAGKLPVFLFGSTASTLRKLERNLQSRFNGLVIAGSQPSRFRNATERERAADIEKISASGAAIVFVGLGCPRQEIWIYENTGEIRMPLLGVGAAFNYHAGLLRPPPPWMQRAGLQWLHRLVGEPRRLWRRYVLLNPAYLLLLLLQATGLRRFPIEYGNEPLRDLRPG